jgi:hypothetical protein
MGSTVITAAIVLFLQIGPPVITPPANVTVQNNVTVQVPEPDPQATADMAAWSFQGIIINVMAPTLVQWTNSLLEVPDFFRTTPPDLTYNHDAVKGMAEVVRTVAFGLFALVVLGFGVALMLGQQPSFGRPLYGAALALGNLFWWQWGVDLNNVINTAIAAPELGSIVRPHLTLPALTTNPAEAFGPALLVVAYAIVCLLLIGAMAFRLGLLDILIVVGSLALLCKGSELSERFTATYASMATGTLFAQTMVVVALKLSAVFGFAGGGLTSTLLGLIVLLLARRMPGLLASRLNSSGGIGIGRALLVARRVVARV